MGMAQGFCWYEYLGTDLGTARRFYRDVFGWGTQSDRDGYEIFASQSGAVGGLRLLPAVARERGAPPHWLGHVYAQDPERGARDAQEREAQVLGPIREVPGVGRVALVRDPQGAVLALSSTTRQSSGQFAARELASPDNDAAWAFYEPLLDWRRVGTWELGADLGAYLRFEDGAGRTGGMSNSARLPGVHPHWVYYAAVDDAVATCERVTSAGGRVLQGPFENPRGDFIAYCEDALGAAFGLLEPGSSIS